MESFNFKIMKAELKYILFKCFINPTSDLTERVIIKLKIKFLGFDVLLHFLKDVFCREEIERSFQYLFHFEI